MFTVERFPTASAFLDAAELHLLQAEVENNLILGIARALAALAPQDAPSAYFALVRDREIQGCAFSTLPDKLGLTRCTQHESLLALAGDAESACPRVTHIIGPEPTVAAFAREVGRLRGRQVHLGMAQRIHVLDAVDPPVPSPPGQFRLAQQADVRLVTVWVAAFMADVGDLRIPLAALRPSVTCRIGGSKGSEGFFGDVKVDIKNTGVFKFPAMALVGKWELLDANKQRGTMTRDWDQIVNGY